MFERVKYMYARFLESFMRIYMSRGESFELAKFSAAIGLSTMELINLSSFLFLFGNSPITTPISWMMGTPWALTAYGLLSVGINWILARKVSIAQLEESKPDTQEIFYWYAGASIVILIVGFVIALKRM